MERTPLDDPARRKAGRYRISRDLHEMVPAPITPGTRGQSPTTDVGDEVLMPFHSPSPFERTIPVQLINLFSGPSTLNLTSHSLPPFEGGPQTQADPSREPERRRGTPGLGTHRFRTSEEWAWSVKARSYGMGWDMLGGAGWRWKEERWTGRKEVDRWFSNSIPPTPDTASPH